MKTRKTQNNHNLLYNARLNDKLINKRPSEGPAAALALSAPDVSRKSSTDESRFDFEAISKRLAEVTNVFLDGVTARSKKRLFLRLG